MRKGTKQYLTFIFICVALYSHAQNSSPYINETTIILQSEDINGKSFEANSPYSYMLLNTSNGDFLLNFDAVDFRTGNINQDSLIIKQGSQPISFKGNIGENLLLFNRQINDEQFYKMAGQLIINNNKIDCIALFDPINYGDKSETKNYRLNFKLEVEAAKISILGLEGKLNKLCVFEINSGKLNIKQ